jgi:hypothetical protein
MEAFLVSLPKKPEAVDYAGPPPAAEQPEATRPQPEAAGRKCSHCTQPAYAQWSRCHSCGYYSQDVGPGSGQAPSPPLYLAGL